MGTVEQDGPEMHGKLPERDPAGQSKKKRKQEIDNHLGNNSKRHGESQLVYYLKFSNNDTNTFLSPRSRTREKPSLRSMTRDERSKYSLFLSFAFETTSLTFLIALRPTKLRRSKELIDITCTTLLHGNFLDVARAGWFWLVARLGGNRGRGWW